MKHISDKWPKFERWAKIPPKIISSTIRKMIPGIKIGLFHYQLLAVFVGIKLNGDVEQQHGAMVGDDPDLGKISIHNV